MIADKLNFCFIPLFIALVNLPIFASQEHKDYVYEIERSFAEQMFSEFGLRSSGNLNSMHEKVEKLGMQFIIYRR
ncbi:MAG: hypothetical protein H0V82_04805, partial [Candidatus Protochlamydia sp.]|nr:hypothetical protein [Candidatus Protochlamydia sp.]